MPTFTLATPVHAEIEIRKSRFIAQAVPVADRDAAMAVIQALREEHRNIARLLGALDGAV